MSGHTPGPEIAGKGFLTLRDRFAMAALTGMLSSPPIADRTKVIKAKWAEIAYEWADAMLAARRPAEEKV